MYYYGQIIYLERPYAHRQNNHHSCITIDIREGIPPATRQEDVHSLFDFWWRNIHSWDLITALWSPNPAERPSAVFLMRLASHTPDHGVYDSDAAVEAPLLIDYPSHGSAEGSIDHMLRVGDKSDVFTENMALGNGLRIPGTRYPSSNLAHLSPLDRPESSQQYSSSSHPSHPDSLSSRTGKRHDLHPIERSSNRRRGDTAPLRPSNPTSSHSDFPGFDSFLDAPYDGSFDAASSGVELPSLKLSVHSPVKVEQSGLSVTFSACLP
jgi:hypothetical protein